MNRNKAPYRLLFNNDTTNILTCISPWHEEGEDFREEMLVASIEELANTGVDAYMLSPGLGWIPWWQSRVIPEHFKWWRQMTGLEPQRYEKYVYEGGDMVQVLIDTCRRLNMAPFVSLRLNDVHHQEHYGQKVPESSLSCRLYTEHPEWHIDPNHKQVESYYKKRGMNWAIPEVRAYKLSLLEELCEKYELAGLELDFLRDDTMFRLDETTEAERIETVTGFIKDVRAAMDKHSAEGERKYLSVRMPINRTRHGDTGLDVERMYEAGVDMFNLSCWYDTTQQTSAAEVRAILPDAAIYVEMTHVTGNHTYFLEPGKYGCPGNPKTSDHQFYTTTEIAYERGADGMSLFNFVYYRMGHQLDIPIMEPPFHVLPKLLDREFLARQSQYYMLGGTSYFRQVPRLVEGGKTEQFLFDMVPRSDADRGSWTPDLMPFRRSSNISRLRLHAREPIPTDLTISATFNGTELEPTDDVSRYHGNPCDGMISPKDHRRAWVVPKAILQNGMNDLEVHLPGGESLEVIYLDAWIV